MINCVGRKKGRLKMTALKKAISIKQLQYLIFIGLSLGIIGFTVVLYFSNSSIVFHRFLGDLNPIITIILVIFISGLLLSFPLSRAGFVIYKKKKDPKALSLSFGLVILLAFIMILIDSHVHFPKDMNVLFPQSLLFYPTIGFVVETLFHLLPLAFLFTMQTSLFKKTEHQKIIWPCILIVSSLEPIYQTIGSIGSSSLPLWTVGYVGVHVFVFNLLQLVIFKRYDFLSMYSLRLGYYLLWHIVWGYMRLHVLF
jgi:hypothetical protein